jgi:hypothetical protein
MQFAKIYPASYPVFFYMVGGSGMTDMIDKVGVMLCISSLSCNFTIRSDCDDCMSAKPMSQKFQTNLGGGSTK